MKKIGAGGEIYNNPDTDVKSYGLDVEKELLSALSEELAKNIDREILKGLGIEPDKNKRRMNKIGKIIEKNEESNTT